MTDVEDLQPPDPRVTPELEWVLRSAFSTESPRSATELTPTGVWSHARHLGLTERIGARRDLPELPGSLADEFKRAYARSIAIGLLYEKTAREIAEIAHRLDVPLVFLKGPALVFSGITAAGARSFGDLDVLVPADRAQKMFDELLGSEFSSLPAEPTEQHLPELRPARGGSLEVHFALRGVQIAGGRPAGFEDLEARSSFRRLTGFPGSSYLPDRLLLAAHVLVHGFQQHLLRPATYPLFRMIADLIDALPDGDAWSELHGTWHAAIQHAVTDRSFEATRALCDRLRAGEWPDPKTEPDPTRLLRHLLAGSSDPQYSASLRGAYLRRRLAEAYRRGELGGYLKRKIRPLFRGPQLSSLS